MTYVYVRWQPNHPWPEIAFASEAGRPLKWQHMNEAPGPPSYPQMWSAPVPNESPQPHAGVGVEPALHGENGPDSRDAT